MVAKVRERLAVSKQAAQNFDWERFNLRKLNDLEVRKQYRLRLQTGLQLWRTCVMTRKKIVIGRTFKKNIKISAKEILGLYELKQY